MATAFINGTRPPYAREVITATTSSVGLTAATYNTAQTSSDSYNRYDAVKRPEEALIQVKGAAINWTLDGTAPTATAGTDVGFVNQVGDFISLVGNAAIVAFRCINAVASSGAKIEVVYFR